MQGDNALNALRADVNELQQDVVDIKGVNGDNGKIGKLAQAVSSIGRSVDTISSRAWWAFTVFVAAIGGAAVKLVIVGQAYGEMHSDVEATKNQIRLQSAELQLLRTVLLTPRTPASSPDKDIAP